VKLVSPSKQIFSPRRRALCCATLLLWLAFYQVCAQAAGPSPAPQNSETLANGPESVREMASLEQIRQQIVADPGELRAIITRALRADVRDAIRYTGEVVGTVLRALPKPMTRMQVVTVIVAATKARPEAVLEIVRVAIQNTAKKLHRDVVAAAVAAVPNPYLRAAVQTGTGGYKATTGQGPTLAESILQAALDAGSGENRDELSRSISAVLWSATALNSETADGSLFSTSAIDDAFSSAVPLTAAAGFGPAPTPLATPPPVSP
jgi:hypothetical protein